MPKKHTRSQAAQLSAGGESSFSGLFSICPDWWNCPRCIDYVRRTPIGRINHERTKRLWAVEAERRAATRAVRIKNAVARIPKPATAWDPVNQANGKASAGRSLGREEIAALYPGVMISEARDKKPNG